MGITNGTLNMSGGTIANNEAVFGGGVFLGYPTNTPCRFNMTGGVLEENTALYFGGGIHAQNTNTFAVLEGTENTPIVRGNACTYSGGGISIYAATLTVSGARILGNTAREGGGIWVEETGTVAVAGASAITGNTARASGGGIFTEDYSYSNPADPAAYANINTAADTLFLANSASAAYTPPSNAARFANIGYAATSIGAAGSYIHPLNNFDINYIGPQPLALYTVTYDPNGGVGGFADENIPSGPYSVRTLGETGILRPGFTFAGWNTARDGSGEYYEAGDEFAIDGDITLYARWTPVAGPYDVIYDPNGGLGSYGDTGIPNGADYTVRSLGETGITREGFTFTGWNTQRDGSGMPYAAGDVFAVTGNVILYAQWEAFEPLNYAVVYDANGGLGGYIDANIPSGTLYRVRTLGETGIIRPGYTFVGWNTAPDGNGIAYAPGAAITIGANLVLYAQWQMDEPERPCCCCKPCPKCCPKPCRPCRCRKHGARCLCRPRQC